MNRTKYQFYCVTCRGRSMSVAHEVKQRGMPHQFLLKGQCECGTALYRVLTNTEIRRALVRGTAAISASSSY